MKSPGDITVVITTPTHGLAQPIRMALRGMGVRNVQVALTHRQTIEAFQVCHPDVLIAFVEQPEGDDGLALIRFIRRWDKSPNRFIPIVAASPRAELSMVAAVINAGGNEFAVFPASGDTLMKRINAAMQSARPFIDTPGYVGPCRRRRTDPSYHGPERRTAAVALSAAAEAPAVAAEPVSSEG